uniref:Gamma-tubulin complex component n=1 Tax=Panagrellus redivivus TaxID=6233 RepID=A0A7E4V064_PANRE
MDSSKEVSVWRFRRVKILETLNEKLIPIGRVFEFPTFENAEGLSYSDYSPEGQRDVLFDAIKRNILGDYTPALYPYEPSQKKIKFKIASGLTSENKVILQKFVNLLRYVVQVRIYLSKILTNTTCGVVARTVAEIIRDYVTITLPTTVEAIFNDSDGNLVKLESNLQHFTSDMTVLSKSLYTIFSERYVGGEIITYLDRPEVQQMPANYCAVPVLFNQCIREAIKHYDNFLEEWLYTGMVTTDRQHEFVIWDLSRSKCMKASIFDDCGIDKPEIPFDSRFVFIKDLVPSIWKNNVDKMAQTAFRVRRLISVLTHDTQVPFTLEFHSIVDAENMATQNAIVRNAYETTGAALLQKINSVINIQEFFKFLYELIFDPCTWMNSFAADLEDYRHAVLNTSDDPYRIANNDDTTGLNSIFNDYFGERLRSIVNGKDNVPDVVDMRLYNHNLFSKNVLNDLRLVDMLNYDYDLSDLVNEEHGDGQPSENGLSSDADYGTQLPKDDLPFVEKVGIGFTDMLLFQFLVTPEIQEDYNRLFRLRLALARAELLIQRKRTTDIKSLSNPEQLFISSILSFLRRVSMSVFGHQAASQWELFADALPKLRSVTPIVHAQRLMHRNINTQCGLFSDKKSISAMLTEILDIVNNYALNELCFDDAADRFYEVYEEMRKIVCDSDNKMLKNMTYSIFRVSVVVPLSKIEKVSLDPRKGLAPQPNLARGAAMRRSVSVVALQSGAGRK